MEYHVKPNALVEYAESFSQIICDQFFAEKERVSGRDLVKFTAVPQVNAFLVKSVFEGWQQEAASIQSPLFDYTAPAVKEQLGSLMKTLSSNISIGREYIEPMVVQAAVDTFILTFNPKQYFRKLFGQLPDTINAAQHLKGNLKYTKLHPQFIEKAYVSIEKSGDQVKLKKANEIMEHIAEDVELFSDPEEIANQFQQVKDFMISNLVSDWIDEASITQPRGIMSIPGLPDDEEEVPEIDASFEEKNEHYEEEDYIPEEEEMAIYNEEDMNSEEAFIGNDERILTEADLNGIELPNDEHVDIDSPSLDDELNLTEEQPSLDLDDELTRTASLPNVERVGLPNIEIEGDSDETDIAVEEVESSTEEEVLEDTTLEEITITPSDEESNTGVSNYPPLKGTIPLNMKFKFQRELFNGDNAEFSAAIEMIDQCKDYHTAIALVKEKYIRPYDWDLAADATVDFLSMIDKKFE